MIEVKVYDQSDHESAVHGNTEILSHRNQLSGLPMNRQLHDQCIQEIPYLEEPQGIVCIFFVSLNTIIHIRGLLSEQVQI